MMSFITAAKVLLHSPKTISKSPNTNTLITLSLTNSRRTWTHLSCQASLDKQSNSESSSSNKKNEALQLGKLAAVALAAGVLVLGSVDGAMAAKSGGRVGGQAFRSAPRSSGPRINNNRTNIYVNPPVAPPLIGGYGYGSPYYGGGWGWSPFSYFLPGPGVAVGGGGGLDIFFWFLVLGTIGSIFRNFFGRRNDDYDDYDD